MADTRDTSVVRIDPFKAENMEADVVIQDWRTRAEAMSHASGLVKSVLHQRILDEAPFDFVNVATWSDRDAFHTATSQLYNVIGSSADTNLYRAVIRSGQQPQNPESLEYVILINPFQVPAEESDRFLDTWLPEAQIVAQQPGFVSSMMHRALAKETPFQFINYAWWTSADDWIKMNQEGEARRRAQHGRQGGGRAFPSLY